jgi:hypothetical protein
VVNGAPSYAVAGWVLTLSGRGYPGDLLLGVNGRLHTARGEAVASRQTVNPSSLCTDQKRDVHVAGSGMQLPPLVSLRSPVPSKSFGRRGRLNP